MSVKFFVKKPLSSSKLTAGVLYIMHYGLDRVRILLKPSTGHIILL